MALACIPFKLCRTRRTHKGGTPLVLAAWRSMGLATTRQTSNGCLLQIADPACLTSMPLALYNAA